MRFEGLRISTPYVYLTLCLAFLTVEAQAGAVGDVTGDGKVDLLEAVYALEVAAGKIPGVDPGCLLVGKGEWQADTTFQECDLVEVDEIYYVAKDSHLSSSDFSKDTAHWAQLTNEGWVKSGSDLSFPEGNVGIGSVTPPVAKLDVAGGIKLSSSTVTCDATHVGVIQYDPDQGGFVGCAQTVALDGSTHYTWLQFHHTIPTVYSNGRVWMDRNLGASQVATSGADELAYGDLYQWGRLTDGHEKRDSAITQVPSDGDVPGHGDFIAISYNWRSTNNPDLWQGTAGTNNPCPSGFRVPTVQEWQHELESSWPGGTNLDFMSHPLKLSYGGMRLTTEGLGSMGLYWSSTWGEYLGAPFALQIENSYGWDIDESGHDPSRGYSVRCIKD